MTRLTKPQLRLLRECSDPVGTYCAKYYRPAIALFKLGFVTWEDGDRGSCWLNITDEGRAALNKGGRDV